ncbi:hypothetical protein CR513_20363, partial [Mucuna pruriens]
HFPLFTAFQSETGIVRLCSVSLHLAETKSDRSLPRSSQLSFCREQLGHCRDESTLYTSNSTVSILFCIHFHIAQLTCIFTLHSSSFIRYCFRSDFST